MKTEDRNSGAVAYDCGQDGERKSSQFAFVDSQLFHQDDLQGVRVALESTKPELGLREEGVGATIAVFGSARMLPEDNSHKAAAICDFHGCGGQD